MADDRLHDMRGIKLSDLRTKRYVYEPPPLPGGGFYNPEALWPMPEPEPDILDVTRDIARSG